MPGETPVAWFPIGGQAPVFPRMPHSASSDLVRSFIFPPQTAFYSFVFCDRRFFLPDIFGCAHSEYHVY